VAVIGGLRLGLAGLEPAGQVKLEEVTLALDFSPHDP